VGGRPYHAETFFVFEDVGGVKHCGDDGEVEGVRRRDAWAGGDDRVRYGSGICKGGHLTTSHLKSRSIRSLTEGFTREKQWNK
jgi:hypothetical protein